MNRKPQPQDVSWFLDAYRNGQLNLSPPYQRKSAWTPKDRRAFLDTVFRNYPCPAIFLHKEMRDGKTVYNVVDGKQRLETILGFADGVTAIDKSFGDDRLNGKKFAKLDEDLKKAFWNYSVPVEMIDFDGTATLNDIFARLNRNARKLERQEIRHSQFEGWLMKFVENESEDDFWREFGVSTKANVRRMKDQQFISELLLVVLERRVHGFDQDHLDEKYSAYDDPEEQSKNEPFDPEDSKLRFVEAKRFISDMEAVNQCVTQYADTFASFYSLWAWIVIARSREQTPTKAAALYESFMKWVSNPTATGWTKGPHEEAKLYSSLLKGATTDEEPRNERLRILTLVLK